MTLRRRAFGAAMVLCLAGAAAALAQQNDPETIDPGQGDEGFTLTPELNLDLDDAQIDELGRVIEDDSPEAEIAPGAVLRGLDKLSGELADLELVNGESAAMGRLTVTLGECRYPAGNPAGDAYAYLEVRVGDEPETVFEGWMIASSPALNAMDHPRYDLWVLRCSNTS